MGEMWKERAEALLGRGRRGVPLKGLTDCMENSGAGMSFGVVSVEVKDPDLFTPLSSVWAVPGWAGTMARQLSAT